MGLPGYDQWKLASPPEYALPADPVRCWRCYGEGQLVQHGPHPAGCTAANECALCTSAEWCSECSGEGLHCGECGEPGDGGEDFCGCRVGGHGWRCRCKHCDPDSHYG